MRVITEIVVHCSATKPHWMAGQDIQAKVAEIRRWHVEDNGWVDIGYNFVIDRDGQVMRGRKAEVAGAHVGAAVNARSIGVCLIGGYGSNENDSFEKHYTQEQDEALRKLIRVIQHKYPSAKRITGHNDYAARACPGFKVDRWLARKPSRTFSDSGTAQGSSVAAAAGGGLAAVEVAKAFATEAKTAVAEVQAARADVKADPVDPLRWVLLAVIVVGAAYALYRRWIDWKAGRQ